WRRPNTNSRLGTSSGPEWLPDRLSKRTQIRVFAHWRAMGVAAAENPLLVLPGAAFLALADPAEVLVGVDAGIVAVAPVDPDGVVAHRFHGEHLERRLEHREWIVRLGRAWGGAVGAAARGAGALVAQVDEAVIAGVAILPIDLDAFRFGNGDVFGVGG